MPLTPYMLWYARRQSATSRTNITTGPKQISLASKFGLRDDNARECVCLVDRASEPRARLFT